MSQDLLFEIRDRVAVVTLNRPEQRNAFSGPMGAALGRAYRECDGNDEVRAVVVTGAGSAFCAGADLGAGDATFARREESEFSAAGVDPPAWEVRKPVIAAMNGHAVGIGLTLAMQCDIRIVARDAKFGFLHVRRGVIPDAYAHWSVPRVAGFAVAAELMLSGRTFCGEEAVALGLASRALPALDVLPAALALGRDIAENAAPLSVAITKRLLWAEAGRSRAEIGRLETQLHHAVMGQEDAAEGVRAWLERRPPRWQGSVVDDWPEWPAPEESEE